MTYAPMLCVLFIACHLRVEFLSNGKGQPQQWVQACMYALTFAVLATSLVVLLMPLFSGVQVFVKESGTPDIEAPRITPRFGNSTKDYIVLNVLTGVRFLIMLGLYGGIAGVIVGIHMYLPPGENDLSKVPAPAPAVVCTMILVVVFFMTQLVIALCQTYIEMFGDYYAGQFHKIIQVMNAAASTVEFAPMVSIVFLAARMRALQHNSQPQEWSQTCMYAATGALCLNTLLAIIVPCVWGGSMTLNERTKQPTFEVPQSRTCGYILVGMRFLCMTAFYAGVGCVIYSIYAFDAPEGKPTQPVSPTVQCVVNLTCQFFFVYGLLICCLTVSEVSGGAIPLETYRFYSAIEAAKSTLPWAPMLAILFVTTRMYALLITNKKGAPQAWVQDGMYMATYSLMISFVACLIAGMVMDKVETDEDGNIVSKVSSSGLSIAMTVLRYFTMTLLYGGIITVIIGLFVMTPETANGKGSIPLLSNAVNATPFGGAPPGPHSPP